jgi:hypothetical protein
MQKYNEPIYNKKYVQEALKISLWERLVLLFIPSTKVENEETISHYKKFNGKFYLVDFNIKKLVAPSK